jgi:hypothetical protein
MKTIKIIILNLFLFLLVPLSPALALECRVEADWARLLNAIRKVESSDGKFTRGDGGEAIGPYQIHRAYWYDAMRFLNETWPYSWAAKEKYARAAVRAYLQHYGRGEGFEQLAAIHNAGPDGVAKLRTNKGVQAYVGKIMKELE